LITGLCQA